MTDKPVYIIGNSAVSKPRKSNPTQLIQAQTLGYIKWGNDVWGNPVTLPVLDIHEIDAGFQIEVDKRI